MNPAHPFGLTAKTIDALRSIFRASPGIERVTIYGSRAMGNFREGSDIDLVIDAKDLGLSDLLRIETQIEELMLPYKVDLSLRHLMQNEELLQHILRVGVRFYPEP